MRKCLRAAEKDGFTNIAVVCGAWHAPALKAPAKVGDDNALLKNLPKHKVAATWIPWTDERHDLRQRLRRGHSFAGLV